jgi:hypothetical protein
MDHYSSYDVMARRIASFVEQEEAWRHEDGGHMPRHITVLVQRDGAEEEKRDRITARGAPVIRWISKTLRRLAGKRTTRTANASSRTTKM